MCSVYWLYYILLSTILYSLNNLLAHYYFVSLILTNPETGRGRAFPDYNSNAAMCSLRNGDSYFGNELNFVAVPQMIVTGAA